MYVNSLLVENLAVILNTIAGHFFPTYTWKLILCLPGYLTCYQILYQNISVLVAFGNVNKTLYLYLLERLNCVKSKRLH